MGCETLSFTWISNMFQSSIGSMYPQMTSSLRNIHVNVDCHTDWYRDGLAACYITNSICELWVDIFYCNRNNYFVVHHADTKTRSLGFQHKTTVFEPRKQKWLKPKDKEWD